MKKWFDTARQALGKQYSLNATYILDKDFILFFAIKPHSDKWHLSLKLMIYFPRRQGKKWFAYNLSGLFELPWFGGVIDRPKKQLVFISDAGNVHVSDTEVPVRSLDPIPNSIADLGIREGAHYFNNAKSIDGVIYTVNNLREVFKYSNCKWIQLKKGITDFGTNDSRDYGFDDIDGFSGRDIYAAGGDSDLWHWNGKQWKQINIPTDASLKYICCGGDGIVYMMTNMNTIVYGRGHKWRILRQDVTDATVESMIWFEDRIYISSSYQLFQIKDKKFSDADEGRFRSTRWGKLATGDGIMATAMGKRIGVFDGKAWAVLSE